MQTPTTKSLIPVLALSAILGIATCSGANAQPPANANASASATTAITLHRPKGDFTCHGWLTRKAPDAIAHFSLGFIEGAVTAGEPEGVDALAHWNASTIAELVGRICTAQKTDDLFSAQQTAIELILHMAQAGGQSDNGQSPAPSTPPDSSDAKPYHPDSTTHPREEELDYIVPPNALAVFTPDTPA